MSIKDAKASNWVAERADTTATSFDLKGSTKSYTTFSKSFSAGQTVFYSAHDEDGNREAGYGDFDGSTVITRNPTATLVNGIYEGSTPPKVDFTGEVTVACTFNASAFNTLWAALDAIDPDGDGSINIPPELINGLIDNLNSKAEQADLEKEIQDRIDGDKALQDQIDVLDPDGDRKVDWSEIEGKPAEFPPSAHQQGWDTITGKPADYPPSSHGHAWGEITGKPSEFPPSAHNHDGDYLKAETDPTVPDHVKAITTTDIDNWNASGAGASSWDDLTGKPTEFPPAAHNQGWDTITGTPSEYPPEDHTHEQSEVDGLELRLDAIEGSISSGGGFVDANNDGKLYGRQSEAWAEIVIPDGGASSWDEIADKPTEFPPAAHNQGWDTITDKPDDFPPSTHGHAWGEITGKPTEFPPEDHTHVVADITDFDPSDYQPKGNYALVGTSYTKAESDSKWQPKGSYQPSGNYALVGASYTKAESDSKWQVKGSYAASSHNHQGVYQPAGEYIGEAPNDGKQYSRQFVTDAMAWSEIVIPDGGSGGNIADGTTDGIVATWDSTANSDAGQWTPESSLTIDAAGDATFSGSVSSSGTMTPSSGLKTWLWVHGNNDQIGLTINATENRLVPYGDSKDVMDLGATTSKFKDAHFSGAVNIGWLLSGEDGANLVVGSGGGGGAFNRIQIMKPDDPTCLRVNSTNANGVGTDAFKVDQQGNCTAKGSIAGTFMVQDGSPVIDAKGLIKTLSTLRNATKDETTLKGLRDSIGNAIGGLIEEFENEIATMPTEGDES